MQLNESVSEYANKVYSNHQIVLDTKAFPLSNPIVSELNSIDKATGAYPIAYVTKENDNRFLLHYPSGQIATFPFRSWAEECAEEYNQVNLNQ